MIKISKIIIGYGFLLLIVGMSVLLPKFRDITLKKTVAQNKQARASIAEIVPTQISIPKLHLKSEIRLGMYDPVSKNWSISNDSAYWAQPTSVPNQIAGNTLIYAHNSAALFGKTQNLQKGDLVQVQNSDNQIYVYSYVSHRDVLPDNLEVFKQEPGNFLTLLTCSGTWNEQRRLMTFRFEKTI